MDDRGYHPQTLVLARRLAVLVNRFRVFGLFYWIVGLLLYPLMRLWFSLLNRVEVHGKENLSPTGSSVLLMSNHISAADGPLLATILWPRALWFVAKESIFRSRGIGLLWMLFTGGHSIPLRRSRWDKEAVDLMLALARQGRWILIFPEGTRSRTGKLQRGKAGVGLLVRQTRSTVIPVLVKGTEAIMPVGKPFRFRRGHKIVVCIGKAMSMDQWWNAPANKDTGRQIVNEVMEGIAALQAGD